MQTSFCCFETTSEGSRRQRRRPQTNCFCNHARYIALPRSISCAVDARACTQGNPVRCANDVARHAITPRYRKASHRRGKSIPCRRSATSAVEKEARRTFRKTRKTTKCCYGDRHAPIGTLLISSHSSKIAVANAQGPRSPRILHLFSAPYFRSSVKYGAEIIFCLFFISYILLLPLLHSSIFLWSPSKSTFGTFHAFAPRFGVKLSGRVYTG